jgi:Spy/CpxP family protein refolding chaperone
MLQHKSSKLLIAVAVIGMLTFATQGFSQGHCYWDNWDRGAGAGWWNNNVPTQYALSAEQITKINDIRTQYLEDILPLQNQVRSLRIESRGYSSRYDAEVDKIREYRNKMRDLEGKIENYRLDMREDINKVLTKEQRLYFNDGGYGWWDMNKNWWHEGSHGMRGMMNRVDRCCW